MSLSVKNNNVDETVAARLFAEACASGSCAELAKRLSEGMRFLDLFHGKETELRGKADFLRYLTADIKESKEKRMRHNISFGVGTVELDGVRRPAAARFTGMYLLTALFVLNDSHGAVVEVVSLPRATFASFIAETLIPNRDLPEGADTASQEDLGLLCPEYRLLPLPDTAPELPFAHFADFAEKVMAVKRFLEAQGTPCVAIQTRPLRTPHLWFREADGRLAYICVEPIPMPHIFMAVLKLSYHGYSATLMADGSVSLGELRSW